MIERQVLEYGEDGRIKRTRETRDVRPRTFRVEHGTGGSRLVEERGAGGA